MRPEIFFCTRKHSRLLPIGHRVCLPLGRVARRGFGGNSRMSATGAGNALRSDEPTIFKSLTATVASALQRDLVNARYMPGQKLPIVQLAKHYGVSPGAVREALSRLISEGLVEFNEQRGFRAAPVPPNALADITRTRILIDVQALREAIRLGDVDWEAEVLAIASSPRQLCAARCRQPESRARGVAAAASHLPPHADLGMRLAVADALPRSLVRPDDPLSLGRVGLRDRARGLRRDPNAEHAAIVEAAVARDADKAALLLEQHYSARRTGCRRPGRSGYFREVVCRCDASARWAAAHAGRRRF